MKIWLDDERPAPWGYTRTRTAEETIHYLRAYGSIITTVDLDHDLGPPEAGTGYDVLTYIEELVHTQPDYYPPCMQVHTANPVARSKMLMAVSKIVGSALNKSLGLPNV